MSNNQGAAIIVGVGPEQGLGASLCRRFAADGYEVFAAGRTVEKIETVAQSIRDQGGRAEAVKTDSNEEADVRALFAEATHNRPPPALVVYNTGNNARRALLDMEAEFFEHIWRTACFGGFLVGREAARHMVPAGRGTILFTGATASLRGKPPFTAFAVAKAGLRALAQSMAREFGPSGIHVAHIIIDGVIHGEKILTRAPEFVESKGADGMLQLADIADAYAMLHQQKPSAWSFELDLRPYKETF